MPDEIPSAFPYSGARIMSGGEAIVETLVANGVDTVFGLPGVQTYELFDALARAGDRIRVVTARHEQAAAYMAFGYARSTGRVGVFTVVPGPGVLNAAAALCTAYGASAPVLCLTSEVPRPFIGSGLGHLHELPDQLGTLRSIVDWAEQIDHPARAPRIVADALRQAASGRPRPVAVQCPWDVLEATAEVGPAVLVDPDPPRTVDRAAIERAAHAIAAARHPMIMVGSGAQDAAAEVRALAELLGAPVVSHRGGRGVVDVDHPLGFTCAEGAELWPETDLVVGIGSRMELMWFRWPDRPPGLQVVTIDIDPAQQVRLRSDIGITADARDAVPALTTALAAMELRRTDRTAELRGVKAQVADKVASITPHAAFLGAIRKALPADGILVEEACQAGFTSYFGFDVHHPRTFISCGHQGTLGFGFPTALGVKVAHPDTPVVALTGDGGFGFGLQELATAAQERIALVTVLFDNGAYGNVLRDQQNRFDGRSIASHLHNPDWLQLAESFGVTARRAQTAAELATVVEKSLAENAPALIVVPVDPADEQSPWPLLMPPPRQR